MRAVHSCDFCGDDAVGTFEVVPDDLLRTDADQRRVALCEHCRTTLEGVLEPFIDRDGSVTDEQADGERVTDAETTDLADDGDAAQAPTSAAVDATARAEGIAIGRADEPNEERVEDDTDDPLAADDGVAVETADVDETAEVDETADVGEEPDQFRTVMRLLSNREFPVDRAEFAGLAAGAYGMDESHVTDVIDHAVARGVIVDDAGTLRKD